MPRWLDGLTLPKAAGVGLGVGVVLGGLIAYAGRTPPLVPTQDSRAASAVPQGDMSVLQLPSGLTWTTDGQLSLAQPYQLPMSLEFGWGTSRADLIAEFPNVCWQSHCRPMGAVLDFLDGGSEGKAR